MNNKNMNNKNMNNKNYMIQYFDQNKISTHSSDGTGKWFHSSGFWMLYKDKPHWKNYKIITKEETKKRIDDLIEFYNDCQYLNETDIKIKKI